MSPARTATTSNGSRRSSPALCSFLVQWDDEIVPRAAALELFGLLGSAKKTLHANPGPHIAVPAFEVASSVDYLDHHLG